MGNRKTSAPGGQRGTRDVDLDDVAAATVTASRALLGVVAVSLASVLDEVSPAQFRALVVLSALGPVRIGVLAARRGLHLVRTVTRRRYRHARTILAATPADRRAVILAGMQAFAEAAGEPEIEIVAPLGG